MPQPTYNREAALRRLAEFRASIPDITEEEIRAVLEAKPEPFEPRDLYYEISPEIKKLWQATLGEDALHHLARQEHWREIERNVFVTSPTPVSPDIEHT